MANLYMAYCPKCRKATTGCIAPGKHGFVKDVYCIICEDLIDANKGKKVLVRSVRKEPKPLDLLRIE